jgi:hypothetical protein
MNVLLGRLCRRVKAPSLSMMILVGLASAPLNSYAFSPPLRMLKTDSRHSTPGAVVIVHSADLDYTENGSGLFLPPLQEQDNFAALPENSNPISKAGVSYQQVVDGIDIVLPPEGLDQRFALSRKDGYWPYITKGDEPPQEFVYGEFDTMFFARVLDRAHELYFENIPNEQQQPDWTDKVFCDLGSGTGRLVLAAAALHRWKKCRGVELLENIHKAAEENLNKCRIQDESSSTAGSSAPPVPTGSNSTGTHIAVAGAPTTRTTTTTSSSSQDPAGQDNIPAWQHDYWRQYKSVMPQDDWLNQLSSSLEEDGEEAPNCAEEADGRIIPAESTPPPQTSAETTSVESPAEGDAGYVLQYALPSPNVPGGLPLAPVEFSCGSFDDPYEYFGDPDCIFVFSTCMGPEVLDMLSRAVGEQCKPGCIVITTEHKLKTEGIVEPNLQDPSLPSGPYKLELLEEMSGKNPVVGGISTVFFYRVVQSLGDGIRRTKPQLSVEEQAHRVAKDLESGELTNTKSFMVGVYNNMAFLGLPASWRPNLGKYS